MKSIKVTPETLESQAAKVDAEAESYYGEYRAFYGDVQNLTSSDWTGEDANDFRNKVGEFEDDFAKMKKLMNEYAEFLRNAAKNYRNTQENVRSSIKGLQS